MKNSYTLYSGYYSVVLILQGICVTDNSLELWAPHAAVYEKTRIKLEKMVDMIVARGAPTVARRVWL